MTNKEYLMTVENVKDPLQVYRDCELLGLPFPRGLKCFEEYCLSTPCVFAETDDDEDCFYCYLRWLVQEHE